MPLAQAAGYQNQVELKVDDLIMDTTLSSSRGRRMIKDA